MAYAAKKHTGKHGSKERWQDLKRGAIDNDLNNTMKRGWICVISECDECMKDAPYTFCCRMECGEHEFCRGCEAEARKQPEKDCH